MKIVITEQQLKLIGKHLNEGLNFKINTYNVEMVTIESLEYAIGEDRNKKPIMMNGVNYSEQNISKLMQDIKLNGFKEPCILAYDPDKGEATIIEGNHRIEAAIRLGLKEVPVQIETMRIRDNFERKKDGMYPLMTDAAPQRGLKPNKPSDLKCYDCRPITQNDFIQNEYNENILIRRSFFENIDEILKNY